MKKWLSFGGVRRTPHTLVAWTLLIHLGFLSGTPVKAAGAERSSFVGLGVVDLEQLLHHGRPPGMFELAQDNDSEVCQALLSSLNGPWSVKRESGPHILMRSKYLLNPWRMHHRIDGPGITEVAFLDIDGDGIEDALFRTLTTMGRDYHMLHIVRSADPRLRSMESLSKQEFRAATRGQEPEGFEGIGEVGRANFQFAEVAEILDRSFLLILDIDYIATSKRPETRPTIQLIKVERKSGLARVCKIIGEKPIRSNAEK